jgi:hypothetical protein
MLQLRNLLFAVLALVFVAASVAQAGDIVVKNGDLTAVLVGPPQAGAGTLDCSVNTLCTFLRFPPLDPGENAQAITVTVSVDGTVVHVEGNFWGAARCGPDPTTPDAMAVGDLPLMTAGTWFIFVRNALPAGTTFSQKWLVADNDTLMSCGPSYCVNSVAGTAPGDCDAM